MSAAEPTFREDPTPDDVAAVTAIVRSTGVFSEEEIGIARELVEDRLAKHEASEYRFVFAEHDGQLVGYTCFGLIPGTNRRYEVYWIAVPPSLQGRKLGRTLMCETERRIGALHGRKIYVETSSRDDYIPTRGFYEACGYSVAARVADHHDKGDDLVIYVKTLAAD